MLYNYICLVFFFSLARLWGKGLTNHSPQVLFFFLSGDQLMHTNCTFLGQDQSTVPSVVQQTETTVTKCFLTVLNVSSLSLIGFP